MSHTRATTIYENVMALIQGDSNTLKKFDICVYLCWKNTGANYIMRLERVL